MDREKLLNGPIEHVVILETFDNKQIAEEFAEIGIIRLIVKTQLTDILEVSCELLWELTAKVLGRDVHLLLFDELVSLVLRRSLQVLPGQRAAGKVNHYISKRFEIIAAGLLYVTLSPVSVTDSFIHTDSQMIINTRITASSPELAIIIICPMDAHFRISVFLHKVKIHDVYQISKLAGSHQEVFWLDIAMDKGFTVDVFDARDQLIGK